jgi:histidinol-phosphate aminotransferase
MNTLSNLVRSNIQNLKPYSSARDEFSGRALVWLDANENPYVEPLELVLRDPATGRETTVPGTGELNRYPDPYHHDLRKKIAAAKGVAPEQLFLGNGSDEVLDLLFRTFCEPGRDEVILQPPTYGMYGVLAGIHGAPVQEVPLDEQFQPDVEKLLAAVTEQTKMIFFCSPNNPTGNTMRQERVEEVLKHFKGLVIVDEAYIDFAPEKSLLPLIDKYDRLVVLQTFSKARGLAGIRLGMAFGNPEIFRWLNAVKLPYNLNRLTLSLAALRYDGDDQQEMVEKILTERERLSIFLKGLKSVKKVWPSDANFVLACFDEPEKVYQHLLDHGIVVRLRPRIPGCGTAIRITIGTEEENGMVMEALGKLEA